MAMRPETREDLARVGRASATLLGGVNDYLAAKIRGKGYAYQQQAIDINIEEDKKELVRSLEQDGIINSYEFAQLVSSQASSGLRSDVGTHTLQQETFRDIQLLGMLHKIETTHATITARRIEQANLAWQASFTKRQAKNSLAISAIASAFLLV